MVKLKTPKEIELMRQAGRIVAEALARLSKATAPGVTTQQLDELAEDYIRSCGAEPAFKGYGGGRTLPAFPATICASINNEVVHGIPGPRKLVEGDIISIDCGALKNGFYGDSAITLAVGRITPEAARLMKVCRESLNRAIETIRPGVSLKEVSRAVQQYVESNNYSVVKKFVGHGIGSEMHEEPQIPNFVAPGFPDMILKPGMTLAIEPMVNEGESDVNTESNGWTVITRDGKLSAHFEHTVAVTATGADILTLP